VRSRNATRSLISTRRNGSQWVLCYANKVKAAPLCTCDVPFRTLVSACRLWATHEIFRSGKGCCVLLWPNDQAPTRKRHKHNCFFDPQYNTPAVTDIRKWAAARTKTWVMSSRIQSGKKNCFVRDITLVHVIIMIIKQLSAAATFFSQYTCFESRRSYCISNL